MNQSVSIKTIGEQWSPYKRYKVNEVVEHNDVNYQNVTGKNTEPSLISLDWYSYNAINDLIEKEIKINGLFFDTSSNTNKTQIEIGNTFRGFSGNSYVVGKVIGLPFDVNDDSKVSLAVNNEL